MFHLPSPIEKLEHPLLTEHGVNLFVKRDDLIHSEVSGNKWRKLKFHLAEMPKLGLKKLVTFGGAYSNHIAATAFAANHFGLEAIGIIRGEELSADSNPTLRRAHELGMQLHFVDRETYRHYTRTNQSQLANYYHIPEGGASKLGIMGVAELLQEIEMPFDIIITAVGTGTTLLGLVAGIKTTSRVLGISVLKGEFIHDKIALSREKYGISMANYDITSNYHFGGYGKTTKELIAFINAQSEALSIKLDPIYTGKALFGVWDMIERGKFDKQTLIFLHTGGLQGIAGYNQKNPQKIHY